jgi:hypothetical protein
MTTFEALWILYGQLLTHILLLGNFNTATFLEIGHGHSLALLDTDDIGIDQDTSDTQLLETEEKSE